MLNATFEMFIPHYIMEYVDNLSNPCLLCEQPKRLIYNCWPHKTIICVPYGFTMRRKYLQVTLVHVLSLTMNIFDKSLHVRSSFEGCGQTFKCYKLTFVYVLPNSHRDGWTIEMMKLFLGKGVTLRIICVTDLVKGCYTRIQI